MPENLITPINDWCKTHLTEKTITELDRDEDLAVRIYKKFVVAANRLY